MGKEYEAGGEEKGCGLESLGMFQEPGKDVKQAK